MVYNAKDVSTLQQIIYSHGFGVDSTGRGLFTDISSSLPQFKHSMFAFNDIDESNGNMVIKDLGSNKEMLASHIDAAGKGVTLICHSQGCVVAALLDDLSKIDRVLFLAPPSEMPAPADRIAKMKQREGTIEHTDGSTSYPRRDGTTATVTGTYLESTANLDLIGMYNQLSEKVSLVIIRAEYDEVLEHNELEGIDHSVKVITIPTNHDFTDARTELKSIINKLLK